MSHKVCHTKLILKKSVFQKCQLCKVCLSKLILQDKQQYMILTVLSTIEKSILTCLYECTERAVVLPPASVLEGVSVLTKY